MWSHLGAHMRCCMRSKGLCKRASLQIQAETAWHVHVPGGVCVCVCL